MTFQLPLLPLWAAVSWRHLQLCCGSRAWVESKRLAKLSWEFGDSFHQFTALGIRWLPLAWWQVDEHFLHSSEPRVGFMVSQQMPTPVPHSLTHLLPVLSAFTQNLQITYLRIQDRDGLGLCSQIKLIPFFARMLKKKKEEHTFKILKQYLTQTLSSPGVCYVYMGNSD